MQRLNNKSDWGKLLWAKPKSKTIKCESICDKLNCAKPGGLKFLKPKAKRRDSGTDFDGLIRMNQASGSLRAPESLYINVTKVTHSSASDPSAEADGKVTKYFLSLKNDLSSNQRLAGYFWSKLPPNMTVNICHRELHPWLFILKTFSLKG